MGAPNSATSNQRSNSGRHHHGSSSSASNKPQATLPLHTSTTVSAAAATTTPTTTVHHQSSPQIVENTLKEFYDYLKHVQGQVQQQSDAIAVNSEAVVLWTDKETKKYLHKLQKFQGILVEQIDRFPLHSKAGSEILDAIQQAVQKAATNGTVMDADDVFQHVSQMTSHVSKLVQEIQLVDLDHLIYLMKRNQLAGEEMDGQDVILLLGATRSGKTTTLHFMAGSTFEEMEHNGSFHLQPSHCPDSTVATYETGCDNQEPVTSHLQTARATVRKGKRLKDDDEDVLILCDTPGLSHDSKSVELDIANGLGMIRAIHKAKSVKPVLVISRDEVHVRERFAGFDGETVASMATLLQKCPDLDLKPFNYVFTKYGDKHREHLYKQFAVMKKTAELNSGKDGRIMRKLLEDIVRKTAPMANVVLPLEEDGEDFLEELWENSNTIHDPKRYFVPFVSYPALKKLQLQLRITLSDLRTSLVEEDQNTAVYRLEQLINLAEVLPEAQDCARLGIDAVKKHMETLRQRIMASVERRDYSMAIHRSQQLVTLAKVLPEAERFGQITHDAVVMLRDLTNALNSMEYETCQRCFTRVCQLAREYPEANRCAQFAMKAAVQHISEFREKVVKIVETLLEGKVETRRYTSLLDKLCLEMTHIVNSEPLLKLCLDEEYVALNPPDDKMMKKVSQETGEAFCIDQVQRLTDQLSKDIPSFDKEKIDMGDMLKMKDTFLSAMERLKILSVRIESSPAGARADSVYHEAFTGFHDLMNSVLDDAEAAYKSTWTDLDIFGRYIWFVAVLLQGPLKNKPYTVRREHAKIEDLERRVLKMMLRLEIEVTRSIERLKNHKFPECNRVFVKPTPIPDLNISELKAPRYLLISIAKNGRIRKLLPTKTDVLEINVCIAMFDHAMLDFWKKVVVRLEQDYAVIVQMQRVNKNPKEILQIAKVLRSDIERVEKEFLGVCGWSDDITSESEADLKRLIRIRDCVETGVKKLEEIVNSNSYGYGLNIFSCGAMSDVSDSYLCRPRASPE